MERQALIDALTALSDEQFTHVANVCHDLAKRVPEHYAPLGVAARRTLGIPEPPPPVDDSEEVTLSAEDVGDLSVALGSVDAEGQIGKVK